MPLTLYKGRIFQGEQPGELSSDVTSQVTDGEGKVKETVLAELLSTQIATYSVGELASSVAYWLVRHFEIRLKSTYVGTRDESQPFRRKMQGQEVKDVPHLCG